MKEALYYTKFMIKANTYAILNKLYSILFEC